MKSIRSQVNWAGVFSPAPRALTSESHVFVKAVKGVFSRQVMQWREFLAVRRHPNYFNVVY